MPSMAVAGTGVTVETMWQKCQTQRMSEVAKQYGLTTQALLAMLQQSGLVEGGNRDPSRQEIKEACRQLQKEWTAEQAASRWVGRRRMRD